MIFTEFWDGAEAVFGLFALICSIWILRRSDVAHQRLIRFVAVSGMVVALLLAADGTATFFGTSRDSLVYSPDRTMALSIRNADKCLLCSLVVIDMYSHRGLVRRRIFDSGDNMVSTSTVRWISNTEATITVEGEGGYTTVASQAGGVTIRRE